MNERNQINAPITSSPEGHAYEQGLKDYQREVSRERGEKDLSGYEGQVAQVLIAAQSGTADALIEGLKQSGWGIL